MDISSISSMSLESSSNPSFNKSSNYKGKLLEWTQEDSKHRRVPIFTTVSVDNGFVAKIDDWYASVASDKQSSKKLAEQHCAYLALQEVSKLLLEEIVSLDKGSDITLVTCFDISIVDVNGFRFRNARF